MSMPTYQRETDATLGASPAEPVAKSPDTRPDMPSGKTLRGSLRFAGEGFAYVLLTQRSFRLQLYAAAVTVGAGGLLQIHAWEWAILTVSITLVLVLQMINTAVEAAVDMVTRDYHPLAKVAKDIAAAALLVASLSTGVVVALVFLPHLWPLIHGHH